MDSKHRPRFTRGMRVAVGRFTGTVAVVAYGLVFIHTGQSPELIPVHPSNVEVL